MHYKFPQMYHTYNTSCFKYLFALRTLDKIKVKYKATKRSKNIPIDYQKRVADSRVILFFLVSISWPVLNPLTSSSILLSVFCL